MSESTTGRDRGVARAAEELAEKLRELRSQTKKSLKELERVTLVSDSSWSRYLAGRGLPPWAAVEALCREVGREPGELRELWEAARSGADRAAADEAATPSEEEPDAPGAGRPPGPAGSERRRVRGWLLAVSGLVLVGLLVAALWPRADGGTAGSDRTAGSAPAGAVPTTPRTPAAVPGALRAGAAVPEQFRGPIELAARRCTEAEVTPALLAAMLKVESDFDPNLRDQQADEYGIARWTPAIFNAWAVDGDNDGRKDYMSPADAIATMGLYTCWLDQRIKQSGLHSNLPALIAAGYRTSDKAVIQAGGLPVDARAYAGEVLRHLAEYAAD
ncbi:helix-turn-helix domain-containing protein [Kitasatospora sp. NPDC056446]|uniref:helix-turn-helix domain-containing protein n=1 Tax=Kitasatospora sp. NPDC056446 TaxID=3345819 RepID=UPI0036B0929B